MIDFSHLFKVRDVRQIQSTIEQMDTESLLRLQDQAEINLNAHSWVSRWPTLVHTAVTTAATAGLVALSQPIAKWRGWTDKSLGQYMKHPAAIGAIALETVAGIFSHLTDLKDTNSVAIARIAEREMHQRHIQRPQLDRVRGYHIAATEERPAAQLPALETASIPSTKLAEIAEHTPAVAAQVSEKTSAISA